jgi:hypothetical protein
VLQIIRFDPSDLAWKSTKDKHVNNDGYQLSELPIMLARDDSPKPGTVVPRELIRRAVLVWRNPSECISLHLVLQPFDLAHHIHP